VGRLAIVSVAAIFAPELNTRLIRQRAQPVGRFSNYGVNCGFRAACRKGKTSRVTSKAPVRRPKVSAAKR